jgi:hypothetical protein
MADGNGSSIRGLKLDLVTIVQVGTIAAAFIGQWYVMNEQLGRSAADLAATMARVYSAEARLVTVERDQATAEVRFENLRDAVMELRRQTNLLRKP